MTNKRIKYFYDTEFLDDGRTIDLISIGIVCDDGREYYAVNENAPWRRILDHPWLMANVIPYLPTLPKEQWAAAGFSFIDSDHEDVKDSSQIAYEVREFILGDGCVTNRNQRELWAYYGAYDHVVLCQTLAGPMVNLPVGIPMFTRDIKQEAARFGNPSLPVQASGDHHALSDARHNKVMLEFLNGYEAELESERASGWPTSLTSPEAREIHDLAKQADSKHDLVGCWCCCLDCAFDAKKIWDRDRVMGIESVV